MFERRESEMIELKKSTSEMKEAIISIVAILNKHGKGQLYFGITQTLHLSNKLALSAA